MLLTWGVVFADEPRFPSPTRMTARTALALTLAGMMVPLAALAQEGTRSNVYRAGEQVDVRASVTGDAVLAGGTVRVAEGVQGDVVAAGGEVDIDATVGEDIRIAGGNVTIGAPVGSDVLAAGGTVRLRREAAIGGDAVLFGGQLIIDGTVDGALSANGGQVDINGDVRGPANVRAGAIRLQGALRGPAVLVADDITVAPGAVIENEVRYWTSKGELTNASFDGGGRLVYDPSLATAMPQEMEPAAIAALAGVIGVYGVLSAALVIALLLLCTKTLFAEAAKRLRDAPGISVFAGLVFVVATPMLCLFLLLTLIGIPLAIALFAFYAVILWFSTTFTAVIFTKMIEHHVRARWGVLILVLVATALYVVLQLLSLVPVVGWLLVALLVFGALGALMMVFQGRVRKVL